MADKTKKELDDIPDYPDEESPEDETLDMILLDDEEYPIDEDLDLDSVIDPEDNIFAAPKYEKNEKYIDRIKIYKCDMFNPFKLTNNPELVRNCLPRDIAEETKDYVIIPDSIDGIIIEGKYEWQERGKKKEHLEEAEKEAKRKIHKARLGRIRELAITNDCDLVLYAVTGEPFNPKNIGGIFRKGMTEYTIMSNCNVYMLKKVKE
ncbi:hypothetical protein COV93_08085 [Candidatus Woesearchaeota archaeon CG11_big_fil_rev_8_21_14_0_20_43_8]|nr:MAG: hypothetical protein COV93_08085 [Candidatus Woesearchaeota archaeon CG11_big_fil_rev_8_21_14_0_20_43_8]